MEKTTNKMKFLVWSLICLVCISVAIILLFKKSDLILPLDTNSSDDVVIAKIGEHKIYAGELKAINGGIVPTDITKMQILDSYENTVLLAAQCKDSDLSATDKIRIDRSIRAQTKLASVVKEIDKNITSEHIKKFYDDISENDLTSFAISAAVTQNELEAKEIILKKDTSKFKTLRIENIEDIPYKKIPYKKDAKAIASLKDGQILQTPIQTEQGLFVVIMVNKKTIHSKPSLDESTQDIRQILRDDALSKYIKALREKQQLTIFN